MYLNEHGYGTLGHELSERGYGTLGATLPGYTSKSLAEMDAKAKAATTPQEKSFWSKAFGTGMSIAENFMRGKISAEQMALQQQQLQQQVQQQQSPMMQYLPYIAIGGLGLIALIVLKK